MRASYRDTIALGLALTAALVAHRFVLQLELMGWDTYPTIAASRIQSLGDFLGSFTEELMDGRYPAGHFYRPVTNLFFALDHALWGIRPLGYHLTDLALLLAGVVSVFVLAHRRLGAGCAPWVATLVFALHPLQLETVPVTARRADMLFTLFVLWALIAQPLGARGARRALVLCALFVVLSAASKETGAIALPLVAGAQWILPARGGFGERTRRMLGRCALPAAGFALFVAGRTAVLGGLGGHPGSSLVRSWLRVVDIGPDYARSLVMPQPWSGRPSLDAWLLVAAVLSLLAALVLAARATPAETGAEHPARQRVPAFLGFWLACLLAITAISGERASWYAVPFLPPYALLLGYLAAAAIGAARARRGAAALVAGAVVLVLLGSHLRYSALFQRYETWALVSRQEREFLERFRSAAAGARPGTTVIVPGLPLGTGTPLERVGIRSALCLSDYSAQAYAELVLPGLPVRVVLYTGGDPTPSVPGVVTIDAVPLPSPALRIPGGASR